MSLTARLVARMTRTDAHKIHGCSKWQLTGRLFDGRVHAYLDRHRVREVVDADKVGDVNASQRHGGTTV
jgi:hypothetical protein